jgi:hypothetical protein
LLFWVWLGGDWKFRDKVEDELLDWFGVVRDKLVNEIIFFLIRKWVVLNNFFEK